MRENALKVDQLTESEARSFLTGGLDLLAATDVSQLVRLTGRWPLLVQLARSRLVFNLKTLSADQAVQRLVTLLREGGPTPT